MTTRTHSRIDLPPHFYRTPQKTRFFDAFDARPPGQPIITFCKENKDNSWCPSQPTASRWLKERLRTSPSQSPERRRRSARPGPKRKEISHYIELMASGPKPLRKNGYKHFQERAGVSYDTLRRRMKERNPPIIRSRCRRTEAISPANKQRRVDYGHEHKHETVESLWQYIHWTDEAHIDRAQAIDQYIFREHGNSEGILMEQPAVGSLVLHIAASVSWHHKSDLIFYNDEHWSSEHVFNVWQSQKPRRNRRTKTEDEYQTELLRWKNTQPPETFKRGNSITQLYYSQEILP